LRGEGAAFTDEICVEPFFGDTLQLAEEVELGVLTGVTPAIEDQVRSEFIEDLGGANVAGVNEIEVGGFADDAGVEGVGGADQVGG